MIIEILLGLFLASNIITNWLLFKLLPQEKRGEITQALLKVLPSEGKVMEWVAPKDITRETAKTLIKELKL